MFALLFVPSHPTPLCWSNSPSRHNLESILGQPTCDLRHNTLVKAQAACDKTPACGGVVKDAGVICEKHTTAGDHNARLDFELRTANPIPGAAQSWQRESCGNHSGAAIRQELGPSNARQGASTPQPDAASDPQRRASLRSGPPSAAFCVVGGLRSLVNSGVSSSLRRDVIEASGAEPADTFLMLNEVSSAADFRQARAALAPVLAVSSASSDCGSPLLKDLCSSVRESIGQASFAPGKSIIQLHWWKLCFDAVVAYEGIARASPYDWTIRLRPDVIALLPLPPLTSFVPNSVHYSRKNADIIFDVFYAVPANKRADFGEALVTLFKPYRSNQQLLSSCCPEEPLGSHLQRHFPMVEVLVPFALQRPCSLECGFMPNLAKAQARHAVIGPNSTSSWADRCVAAARATGTYTVRNVGFELSGRPTAASLIKTYGRCFDWTSPQGFRNKCCRAEFDAACRGMTKDMRRSLGWAEHCDVQDHAEQ